MGDLLLFRERRGSEEYVFATLPNGNAVWAMSRDSGQQWWYQPEHAAESRVQIAAALGRLDELPMSGELFGPAPVQPAPLQPDRHDLAGHRAGHAVLAEVHRLHAAAASSAVGGLPGVLPAEIATYSVGFVGEELVGQQLASLPAKWRVLHAVPVGDRGSDIDHVVIGPAGVFVINTKHHRGATVDVKGDAVFLGGSWQPYIRNSRLEADRALGVVAGSGVPAPVTAVLCVVGGRVRVKEQPGDVVALEAPDLFRWLTSRPMVLTSEQVDQLYDQLRWADAWTASEPPAQAPAWVAELARQLATEHGMASATRRQNSRTRRTSATAATGPARRPASRNPARSRPGADDRSPGRRRARRCSSSG